MRDIKVRKGRRSDSRGFARLLRRLALFENLEPPSDEGFRRLMKDVFEEKRINLLVAEDKGVLAGYALYFFTYSSFLARPTLYLEDLYVDADKRKRGVGFALFRRCVEEAIANGCGRMEWSVLTWNRNAQRFYEKLGANRLEDWAVYRLDREGLSKVPRDSP